MKRGDIYFVVGGAAVGSEQTANRPAVIVSNDIGNRFAPIVEVVYLTTRKKVSLPTHVFIGSAPKPSVALCEQIVTVSKSRLQRRIGRVTQQEINNIDKALRKSLGIHRQEGDTVKLTIRTPFGEMNFDMPPGRNRRNPPPRLPAWCKSRPKPRSLNPNRRAALSECSAISGP